MEAKVGDRKEVEDATRSLTTFIKYRIDRKDIKTKNSIQIKDSSR